MKERRGKSGNWKKHSIVVSRWLRDLKASSMQGQPLTLPTMKKKKLFLKLQLINYLAM